MNEINDEEIDILVEALKAWEEKDSGTDLMFGLLGAMLIPKDQVESRKDWEQTERERKQKQEEEKKIRVETSLILKAKLIGIKRGMAIKKLEQVS